MPASHVVALVGIFVALAVAIFGQIAHAKTLSKWASGVMVVCFIVFAFLPGEPKTDGEACGYETLELAAEPEHQWAECTDRSFGVLGYNRTKEVPGSSGWRGGGYNQDAYCADLAASVKKNDLEVPQDAIWEKVNSSESGRWRGGIERRRQYNYSCTVRMRWEPVFATGRGEVCGEAPPRVIHERRPMTCRAPSLISRLFN